MDVNVASRLVKLRKQNGFSQEVLADKIGVSRQSVSKWERSEASPDTDNLIALANIYNLTLDEMIYCDNETGAPTNRANANANTIADNTQYNVNENPSKLRKVLSYLPYILFPIIVNLMAFWWGWWHPGFLIVFGAPVLKKFFDKKA